MGSPTLLEWLQTLRRIFYAEDAIMMTPHKLSESSRSMAGSVHPPTHEPRKTAGPRSTRIAEASEPPTVWNEEEMTRADESAVSR